MRKTKDRREERNNKTFVSQLKSLKNIPRFIRLIWRISPRLVLLNILLRAVQATLPVCTLYVGKELIDEVVRLNGISKSLESFWNSDVLIFWVWVGFGLSALMNVLARVTNLTNKLLGDWVNKV